MPNPSSFEQAVEKRLARPAASPLKSGLSFNLKKQNGNNLVQVSNQDYPVVDPDPDTLEYFKNNTQVRGMAVGGGMSASAPDSPRVVMVNPYAKLPPESEKYLIDNERIRHFIDEKKYDFTSKPTAQQVAFFKGEEYGKPEHEKYLKQTLVARVITGDESAGDFTPEQLEEASKVFRDYQKAGRSLSFIKKPNLVDTVMPSIRSNK